DTQIDVFADENGLAFGLLLLDTESEREDAIIHCVGAEDVMAVFCRDAVLENDAKTSAVGEGDAFAQTTGAAQAIERAGDIAVILAELGGFAFEAIYFLYDLDGQQDIVLLEGEQGIGIVQQNISVENVILFHARMIWIGHETFGDATCAGRYARRAADSDP